MNCKTVQSRELGSNSGSVTCSPVGRPVMGEAPATGEHEFLRFGREFVLAELNARIEFEVAEVGYCLEVFSSAGLICGSQGADRSAVPTLTKRLSEKHPAIHYVVEPKSWCNTIQVDSGAFRTDCKFPQVRGVTDSSSDEQRRGCFPG